MDLEIAKPLTLPCGLTLRNRLVKAALAESWSDREHLPSDELLEAYRIWAAGGWGAVLTGNLLVDVRYLTTFEDVAVDPQIPRERTIARWKEWVQAANGTGDDTGRTATIVQLNHPGRQGMPWCGKQSNFSKAVAPSAIPLDMGSDVLSTLVRAVMFGTPRAMTVEEIKTDVVARFAEAARMCADAGFAGVQIHAAHGYLLSQFLSARSNTRTDAYGGSASNRARIVVEVINAIREAVPEGFCVSIKLNSADHQSPGEFDEVLEQLALIVEAGVDFVEISGGTYEKPTMLIKDVSVPKSARTVAREAFFLDFAHIVRERFPDVPLMVTGGFRTRKGMEDALQSGACDLIGLGRPAVINPSLPNNLLLNPEVKDEDAKLYTRPITTPWIARVLRLTSITGGAETVWYQEQMRKVFLTESGSKLYTGMGKLFALLGVF